LPFSGKALFCRLKQQKIRYSIYSERLFQPQGDLIMPLELVIFITAILMLLGLAGSLLPVLPGSPLILAGALLYAWQTDFTTIALPELIVLGLLAIAGQGLDYAASALGAKKYGASRWGMAGAFIGGTLGLIAASLPGLILGSFAGAVALEFFKGGELRACLRIGYGTLAGFLCGAIGKVIIALVMIGYFILQAR
jgi:uncharacterized protein YqgC (DUF456 family)